ncbi:hypothetical protein C8Q76DRAFT_752884 [Earliella scabrosa]|nr:hypothetical protein C8Q76DRAFT_752884 [Earliella scabrosa]
MRRPAPQAVLSELIDMSHLPHLRSLSLSNLTISLIGQFSSKLCTLPALEQLSLSDLVWKPHSTLCGVAPDSPPPPEAATALRQRLKTLRIVVSTSGGRINGNAHLDLASILTKCPGLVSVELHFPDAERWVRSICAASSRTLTRLGITIARANRRRADAEDKGAQPHPHPAIPHRHWTNVGPNQPSSFCRMARALPRSLDVTVRRAPHPGHPL